MQIIINLFKIIIITQVDDEMFFFKVSVVSYVFLYADFEENTQKNSGTYSFYTNRELMYGKG